MKLNLSVIEKHFIDLLISDKLAIISFTIQIYGTISMTMDRLYAMKVFVRMAELASFTKAADSLGLPKGSISTSIQSLESHMGTRLLHRTTRRELDPRWTNFLRTL